VGVPMPLTYIELPTTSIDEGVDGAPSGAL